MWQLPPLLLFLSSATVVFVQEVCRHGSRVPTTLGICPWDSDGRWGSDLGELTTVGQRMHFLLGSELRQRYVIQHGLLRTYYNATELFFRSTELNRTIMSAQSQLMGLYPASTGPLLEDALAMKAIPPISVKNLDKLVNQLNGMALPNQWQVLPVHVFPYADDYVLLPNAACIRLVAASQSPEYGEQSAKIAMSNPWLLDGLRTTAFQQFTNEEIASVLDSIVDSIECNEAMDFPLPDFSEELLQNATDSFNQLFSLIYQSDTNARLFASWFFLDLLSHLEAVVAKTEPTKFRLYSAHDTTVAGILAGMQVFDNKQPPFASSLIFEVSLEDEGYFIRVIYNDHPLILPLCEADPCPIATFMNFLRIRAFASTSVCAYEDVVPWSNATTSEEGRSIVPKKGSQELTWVAWIAIVLCVIAIFVAIAAIIVSCKSKTNVYQNTSIFEASNSPVGRKKVINDVSSL